MRRNAQAFALVAAAVLALCAAPHAIEAQNTRLLVTLPGFRTGFPIEDFSTDFEVDAPPGKTYAVAIAAMREMKIPVAIADSTHGLAGNMVYNARGQVAGMLASRLLDCGITALGAGADRFKLWVAVITLVDPLPNGRTKLRVGFMASGQDDSGAGKPHVTCGSSGVLEAKLADLIKAKLK